MEENENVGNETIGNGSFTEKLKGNKKMIIMVAAVVVAIVVIFNVFFNTTGKAKSVVKDFVKATNSCNAKKLMNCIDPYGAQVFSKLKKDDYEDFWDEYKEYLKSDEYKDFKEEYEDSKKEEIEELQESFDELKEEMKEEKMSIKVKEIKSVKKEGKNLYKVKAKIEIKADGDKDTKNLEFYVMKKGLGCKIVGGDYTSLMLMGSLMSLSK